MKSSKSKIVPFYQDISPFFPTNKKNLIIIKNKKITNFYTFFIYPGLNLNLNNFFMKSVVYDIAYSNPLNEKI